MPDQMLPARVTLYDGALRPLGELTTVEALARSYAIMEPTTATFAIAIDDPLIDECDPRLGRALLIESTAYPVPWFGYITRVRWEAGDAKATIESRSYDYVLRARIPAASLALSGTVGAVAANLLAEVNRRNLTAIIAATGIEQRGPGRAVQISDRTPFDALTQMCRGAGFEWWLDYVRGSGGAVEPTLLLNDARGVDLCRSTNLQHGPVLVWTAADINIGDAMFGVTAVGGAADATTAYTERTRVRALRSAQQSQSGDVLAGTYTVHGHAIERSVLTSAPMTRHERLQVEEMLTERGELAQSAAVRVGRGVVAERTLRLAVLDTLLADGSRAWEHCGVGNIVTVSIPEPRLYFGAGYTGPVRIIGVQPNEAAGLCSLVVQVVGGHE